MLLHALAAIGVRGGSTQCARDEVHGPLGDRRTLKEGGAVAATGNTSGGDVVTTIFPFILRGVSLIGIDSAHLDIVRRREVWMRLAHDLRPAGIEDAISEVTLDTLEPALDAILAGEARGRWVVRIGG